MRRLSGADSGFLDLELATQPMHVVAVVLLRPPEGAGGIPLPITLDAVRGHLAARLGSLPVLRRRLKRVPLGLHHPVAFEDPDFDLDSHVASVTLPHPGGPEELDLLVATLAGERLDRGRPLWRLTLADGLDDGRQALLFQVHHALMDGQALMNALVLLFSGGDTGPASTWHPERPPGRWRLLAGAGAAYVRSLAHLPSLIGRSVRGYAALRAHQAQSDRSVPDPVADSPLCSINAGVGPGRRFARATLDLADVRLVKNAAGVSVNDVALALCGGALRSYLEARGELPARPLVASVPVGLMDRSGAGSSPRVSGNQWAILATTLATDIPDPWMRLQTVGAVTSESKACLTLLGRELLRDWLELIPPCLGERVVRYQQRQLQADPEKVGCNVTVSNLRGPGAGLSLAGAEVDEVFFTGPPSNRLGVVFVCSDWGDRLVFGILSVADSVDDPGELAAGLQRCLTGLVKRAQELAPRP